LQASGDRDVGEGAWLRAEPRYGITAAGAVSGEPTGFDAVCVLGMLLPGCGLSKAQGLYQWVMFFVLVAQEVPGLVLFGDPPALNGLLIRIARLVFAPFAPELFGPIEVGSPVCAANTRSPLQPPSASFMNPPWLIHFFPSPKGSSYCPFRL
jgi:hypothetical protein